MSQTSGPLCTAFLSLQSWPPARRLSRALLCAAKFLSLLKQDAETLSNSPSGWIRVQRDQWKSANIPPSPSTSSTLPGDLSFDSGRGCRGDTAASFRARRAASQATITESFPSRACKQTAGRRSPGAGRVAGAAGAVRFPPRAALARGWRSAGSRPLTARSLPPASRCEPLSPRTYSLLLLRLLGGGTGPHSGPRSATPPAAAPRAREPCRAGTSGPAQRRVPGSGSNLELGGGSQSFQLTSPSFMRAPGQLRSGSLAPRPAAPLFACLCSGLSGLARPESD